MVLGVFTISEIEEQVRAGISAIHPYIPGITDDEIKKMYGLRRVVKLNANENALGPSPLAVKAIESEVQLLHLYPDGSSELLRQAVADFHNVSFENVMVGNGSDDLIKLLSETFLDDGDEVVVPHPSFSQYGFGAAIMRANIKPVRLNSDFSYDVEAIAQAVTKKTKLVYLCSPNNPTGTILKRQELEWLLGRLPGHVVVVLDLAYNDFSEHPDRVVETEKLFADPRVCILHTFSKLYGLAGLRIGYGIGHKTLWSYVNRVREPFNVNRVAQRAGAAALLDESHRRESRRHAAASMSQYETLRNEGFDVVPSEGNFVLVKTGDSKGTFQKLMERGILIRSGFKDLDEYVRITFGLKDDNEACIQALIQILHA
jgi:histidinol-phosphate aminotransferase